MQKPETYPMSPPLEQIFLIERRDEEQIMLEMRNQIVKEWVYTIPAHGSVPAITNLSYAGVKEAIRRRGNFRMVPCHECGKTVHVDESESEYRAQVTVHDLNHDIQFVGASSAYKNQPFAWVLAVNKAERNAFRKMLPERDIALLIEQFLRKEAPRPVPPPPEPKTGTTRVGLGPQRLDG